MFSSLSPSPSHYICHCVFLLSLPLSPPFVLLCFFCRLFQYWPVSMLNEELERGTICCTHVYCIPIFMAPLITIPHAFRRLLVCCYVEHWFAITFHIELLRGSANEKRLFIKVFPFFHFLLFPFQNFNFSYNKLN